MNRREFAWTLVSALAAGFASSVPLIMAHGECSFCQRSYPQAAWIAESPDGHKRICDHCADVLEVALNHLAERDYEQALALLERHFPSHVRALPFEERAPFVMM